LIIGAGPAGLAAATELSREGKQFIIVEKDSAVGGLAKTYTFKEGDLVFRTDNGPHRFYSQNKYLYQFIEDLLQEQWLEVKRQTRQLIDGKFYDYPIRPAQALANIGPKKALKMATDYLLAQWQYTILGKEIKNFEDYIVANFGRSLGEFNMINYTEKIWGVPAATIHTDWAKQRIKGLSISFLIKAAIGGIAKNLKTQSARTLVDVFYYPELGTGLIYEAIREKLEKLGCQILLNTYPTKIKHQNNQITEVIFQNEGFQRLIKCNHLIESIHIKDFLMLLDPLPPTEIIIANQAVRYRDQVYLFLTLDKDRVMYDQWIYFPEKRIPFGRVSEMKNFSSKMSPPGKTSLLVEFFCFKNDEIWNKSKEELLEIVMGHLVTLGFCKKKEVRNAYLIKQEKVYPIYDIHYRKYLSVIKNYLDRFGNLYYIGRPGRFRYNNQDHSLEIGRAAARSIIENKKYDLEEAGLGDEYYERGVLQ